MEVVVAVIILLASMAIALKLIQDTGEAQCISQVKTEVDKLKLAMQDLALQSPPSQRTIDFQMPQCRGTSVDVLRFVYFSKPEYCRACAGHFQGCWQIRLASYDSSEDKIVTSQRLLENTACVDIAGDFTILDGSQAPYGSRWSTANPSGCIELGGNPCPANMPGGSCDAAKAGLTTELVDPSNPIARWATLGRWYPDGGSEKVTRLYRIILKKAVFQAPGQGESGAILICVRPVT